LAFSPMSGARLDAIDEHLIARFAQWKIAKKKVKPATVNRSLATLRRALRLAYSWRLLSRLPKFELLPGERSRDFVLSREAQKGYIAAAPEPLRSVAIFSLETGMRIGEVLALGWQDVNLDPVGAGRRGFVFIRKGK